MRGLRALGAPTLDKLRKALPKLESDIEADPDAFSPFFTFAFKFCLTVRTVPYPNPERCCSNLEGGQASSRALHRHFGGTLSGLSQEGASQRRARARPRREFNVQGSFCSGPVHGGSRVGK